MDKAIKNKRDLELVTSWSSGYETSSENSFVSYILPEQVWWCYIKRFLSYSKNYICKFMQANSWHRKLFHFHFAFWNWKCRKEEKKLQKFEYLKNEKNFLDELKIFFIFFEGLSFGKKIRIWWKIADTSFQKQTRKNVADTTFENHMK